MTVDQKDKMSEKITDLEKEIMGKKKELTELRRNLPDKQFENYQFIASDGQPVNLADLFDGRDELLLVHNMGKGCPYCTLWADGFIGLQHHLENRAAFVVVSPDDVETQKQFAQSRGWKFKMFSYGANDFAEKANFVKDGHHWPGVSAFRKTADGQIYRTGWSYFGPGDDFCATWPFLDLFAKGANGWEPKLKY